jgi:hypothetical protein
MVKNNGQWSMVKRPKEPSAGLATLRAYIYNDILSFVF